MPREVFFCCFEAEGCPRIFGHNCSVEEKVEFKRGENVFEEMEKFCYLGNMISCYSEASEAMNARIVSAWKKFRELSVVLIGKQVLFLKQQGKIYQCCVRPVLLYCCDTWELTIAEEMRLHEVEPCMIRMMCGVRLVDGCPLKLFKIGWVLL